jgi:hypothetical protein
VSATTRARSSDRLPIDCPCGASARVPARLAGRHVRCRACGLTVAVGWPVLDAFTEAVVRERVERPVRVDRLEWVCPIAFVAIAVVCSGIAVHRVATGQNEPSHLAVLLVFAAMAGLSVWRMRQLQELNRSL